MKLLVQAKGASKIADGDINSFHVRDSDVTAVDSFVRARKCQGGAVSLL